MSALDAIIQGIIQGITEFLPVSSSGHLSLYQYFFGKGEASLFFSMMLHLGTLVAVIAFYFEDVWNIIKEVGHCVQDIARGRFSLKTQNPNRKMLYMLVLATLPLLVFVFLNGLATKVAEDRSIVAEGVFFLITSALLFLACKARPGKAGIMQMRPQAAIGIGVMQGIAIFPGISRSGATISAGMIMGYKRDFIVKFSFLMSIPTILGGVVFEIGDAVKEKAEIGFGVLALGIITAAVFGYLSIFVVRKLLLSDKFIIFAWYTLILGAVVLLVGLIQGIFAGGDSSSSASLASSITSSIADSSSDIISNSIPPA